MCVVVWDLEDDPEGNVQHIAEHGVTMDEVEEVISNPDGDLVTANRNPSGNMLTFGFTSAGRYLCVAWEHLDDDPLTIYPVTAYDVPEPRRRNRKGKR
jgi:hypothetical protein